MYSFVQWIHFVRWILSLFLAALEPQRGFHVRKSRIPVVDSSCATICWPAESIHSLSTPSSSNPPSSWAGLKRKLDGILGCWPSSLEPVYTLQVSSHRIVSAHMEELQRIILQGPEMSPQSFHSIPDASPWGKPQSSQAAGQVNRWGSSVPTIRMYPRMITHPFLTDVLHGSG